MPLRFRHSLAAFALPFMLAFAIPLFGDPAPGDPNPDDDPEDDVKFDDKQQAKFNAAVAAERKATEKRVRDELKRKSDEEAEKARQQREQDEAVKRGEFDKVKAGLETQLSEKETALEAATAELESLRTLAEQRLSEVTKDLPKEFLTLIPGDDTPIAKRLEQAEAVVKAAAVKVPTNTRGNGPDPKPAGGDPVEVKSPISMREMW